MPEDDSSTAEFPVYGNSIGTKVLKCGSGLSLTGLTSDPDETSLTLVFNLHYHFMYFDFYLV